MQITEAHYAEVPVQDVVPNPDQPRKLFDPTALNELAESIAQHGLLQPIVVRSRPNGLAYKIIAGERRWRAAKIAGLRTIPCRVLAGLDDEQAYVLSVLENVNRADMTPSEEAKAFAQVLGTGRDIPQAAQLFGKTPTYVEARVSLLNLTERHLAMVDKGQVSTSVAAQVARLSPAGQQIAMNKAARGEFRDDNEAKAYCRAVVDAEAQVTFFEVQELVDAQLARRDADEDEDEPDTSLDDLLILIGELTDKLRELAPSKTEKPSETARRLGLDAVTLREYLNDLTDAALDSRRVVRRGAALVEAAQARAEARAAVA